ncbi:Glycosyl hydrolases family 18 [Legionella beliardensis]|uniref:chitinase n=1 Tax=Legionella beliardensis TaxID=91822 RepID=A0A378I142_9GAMM|nr:glycoside hydrolase family 18 protein [Legionella beliardensis]STX28869.1 Glycosyl hydrolases family 18 [Legionella beliardensis]
MQYKKIFSYFVILFFVFVNTVFGNTKTIASPILTKIPGLSFTSSVGQLTVTNSSGKDIAVSTMLLSFSLDQAGIAGLWGAPWLNWQPYTSSYAKKDLASSDYRFVNQANLPNNLFQAGSSITVQYSPQPWNNQAVPENIELFHLSYTLSPVAINSSVSYSGGVNTLTITNASNAPIKLKGAQLKFNYGGQIGPSIWGAPWVNWTVGNSGPDYILNAGTAAQIPENGILTVSFAGDSKPITNISLWVQSDGDTTRQGSMKINIPAAPANVTANPKITLTGPSYPNGQLYTGSWGQPLTINNLQGGSYTLSTPDIQIPTQIYTASFSPNPVIVSGPNPVSVTLSYTTQKSLAKLSIMMPEAPELGIAAPVMTVQGPDFPTATKFSTNWGSSLQVCANGASTCCGISPGNYTLSFSNIYSSTDAFMASGFSNPVVLKANQDVKLPITYVPIPKGSFLVTISMSTQAKKTKQQNFIVSFTNSVGHIFTKNLVGGANSVSLPSNDTYTISAPNLNGKVATVTPPSITVTPTGAPNVSIKYTDSAPGHFVVYFGGWQGGLFNLNTNLPSNVTAVNLSFANITSNLQIDTAPSGWLTNIPAPNVTMQPSYVNWTVYKYNHPSTKVLLAIGGATYSAIWNNVLTAANAETIAQNIAKVINTTYPVYKGNISYPNDLIGQVTIDGVDLDVETGGRLSSAISNNIALLTTHLKKYLNPGKLITFAGFSVGADPNDSQCTVPESIHCGEDIPLLQSTGHLFDWVNVMAYDAGQKYATSLYQIAMANYAKYLPKSKLLLGLDIQLQWPGFSETAEQLAAKALWQKQNGYGGAMFWGVNVQNNPTQELEFITAISAALR